MTSYRNYSTIDIEEKKAAKEKNKRYILYRLPLPAHNAHKRSKRKRYGYGWKWKCVDKHSWEYWVYYCSDCSSGIGGRGRWPATGVAVICLFMIWLLYRLLLKITRLSICGLKIIFSSLAAKDKNEPGV